VKNTIKAALSIVSEKEPVFILSTDGLFFTNELGFSRFDQQNGQWKPASPIFSQIAKIIRHRDSASSATFFVWGG
jgi:hypothetical protein